MRQVKKVAPPTVPDLPSLRPRSAQSSSGTITPQRLSAASSGYSSGSSDHRSSIGSVDPEEVFPPPPPSLTASGKQSHSSGYQLQVPGYSSGSSEEA